MTSVRRERVEAFLSPAELALIQEWCVGALIRPEHWPEQPELRGFLDISLRRSMALMRRTGRARSDSRALELAASRFGLNASTVRRRWERRRTATLATKCPSSDKDRG